MTTKRGNGEGSVRHNRQRGRWEARIVAPDGRRVMVTAKTKTDVLARLNALRHAATTGEVVADGNVTFAEVAERWRERVLDARQLAPTTRERYRWMLERVVAELGPRRLRALTVDDVEGALDRLAAGAHRRDGGTIMRSTLTRLRALVIEVLDFAVRRRLVATNVARLAELTASAPVERRQRSLTPAEAGELWNALTGERLGPLFGLLLLTGLRPGEALGLTWEAIELDAGRLTVRRAVRLEHGRPVLVDELKTSSSYRTIGIGRRAVELLRSHRAAQAVERVAAASWGDERLVFTSERGTMLDPANVRRALRAICHRVGVAAINPNELRHTAASLMNDAGTPLELIADVLGHSGTTMLDRHYRHRVRPSADAAMVLDGLVPEEAVL